MTKMLNLESNATWRSTSTRLRSRVHSCSTVIGNASGTKPAGYMAAFGTDRPTRRGVPPQ